MSMEGGHMSAARVVANMLRVARKLLAGALYDDMGAEEMAAFTRAMNCIEFATRELDAFVSRRAAGARKEAS
jgi:hypothetical protein